MIPDFHPVQRAHVGPPRIEGFGPSHESDFARLLLRLDGPSRHCRFMATVNDCFLEQHSRDAIRTADFLAGAFVGSNLCGVAEAYTAVDGYTVEAAFVVDAAFRGLGFGTALLDATLEWARCADRNALRLLFLPANMPMRCMSRRASGWLTVLDGEVEATIAVAALAHRPGSRQP